MHRFNILPNGSIPEYPATRLGMVEQTVVPSQRILEKLGIDGDTSLTNIGSGNGYFILSAAELVAPAPVYAVDVNTDLLDELCKRAAKVGHSNIQCIDGDARALESLLTKPVEIVLIVTYVPQC